MNKQRKTSFGPKRESAQGSLAVRATPLMRSSLAKRSTLSACKSSQRPSYLVGSDAHTIKDARPLGEKSYMKRLILELMNLLADLHYPVSLNIRMMNPPTNKDFQRIFEYLVNHILGSYKMLGRPDEEMLRVAKDLGYPFNISKSTLNNVGTMNAWPQALGLLSWLCELVRYKVELHNAQNLGFDDDPRKNVKLTFLYEVYKEFMIGNDGPYDDIYEWLKQQLSELDKNVALEVKELEMKNSHLSQECGKKLEEKENCCHLSDELSTQTNNINKMLEYFQQIEDYLKKMKEKSEQSKLATEKRKQEIEDVKEQIIKLKTTIEMQKMKPSDVEKLNLEKKQLQDTMRSEKDRAQSLKNSFWEGEVNFGKVVLSVDEMVHKHNDEIRKLQEALSHGYDDMKADLNDVVPSKDNCYLVTGYSGVEVNNERLVLNIKPFLTSLNNKLLAMQRTLDTELHNISKRILQDKEIVQDIEAKKELLQQQCCKTENDSENYLKEQKRLEMDLKSDLESKSQELDDLKMLRSESLEEMQERLWKKIEHVKLTKQAYKETEAESVACLIQMAKHLKNVQEHSQKVMDNFDEQIKASHSKFIEKIKALSAAENEMSKSWSETVL